MDTQLKIQFLLEFIIKSNQLSKNTQKAYEKIFILLGEYFSIQSSIFDYEKLKQILEKKYNISVYEHESAKQKLYKLIQNDALKKEKEAIFKTLMASNFPQHKKLLDKSKENFELALSKVEAQMYHMIVLYIELLHLSLDLFFYFSNYEEDDVEQITKFAIKVHNILMQNIFYQEEKEHIEDGLKKLCAVYIGLYCKNISE